MLERIITILASKLLDYLWKYWLKKKELAEKEKQDEKKAEKAAQEYDKAKNRSEKIKFALDTLND